MNDKELNTLVSNVEKVTSTKIQVSKTTYEKFCEYHFAVQHGVLPQKLATYRIQNGDGSKLEKLVTDDVTAYLGGHLKAAKLAKPESVGGTIKPDSSETK